MAANDAPPTLTTDRLILEPPGAQHTADYIALWADPDITRYITGEPLDEDAAFGSFMRMVGHWPLRGYGYWMVIDRETGAFVGEVGFVDFKRNIAPSIKGEPEIGWVFNRDGQGRGLATEAAQAAIAWADEAIDFKRMSCLIDPDNAASLRVAEKCGFAETLRTTYKGEPTVVLHRAAR